MLDCTPLVPLILEPHGDGSALHEVGRHAGLYDVASSRKAWTFILGPRALWPVDELQAMVELDALLADDAYMKALAAHGRGDLQRMEHLLDLACQALGDATPDRLTRLRGMAICSRMCAAILPLSPLRPQDFQTRRIATLAGLSNLVQHLVITNAERLVLRLTVVRWGFHIAMWALLGSRRRRRIHDFGEALNDWKALDREHLDSFRALLLSLAAERRSTVADRA
jgi:hypothetical protein